MPESKNTQISMNLDENEQALRELFSNSQDLKYYTFSTKYGFKAMLVYIEEIVKGEIINRDVVRVLITGMDESIELSAENLKNALPVSDVKIAAALEDVVELVLRGKCALFAEGLVSALALPVETWEKRGIDEPQSEAVSKGPREGFIEDIRVNKSLIRKRIMNEKLVFEDITLGQATNSTGSICYMKDIVNESILNELKIRLSKVNIDEILDTSYIEEYIKDAPLSPFNTIGYTEKPEVVAGKILEGRIAVLLNGTPIVLTLPYLFLENFQSVNDYSNHYSFASFLRIIRIVSFFVTIFTPGIYVALVAFHREMIPMPLLLSFISARGGVPFSSFTEIVLMLLAFHIIEESGLRMPKALGQTVSIVGALVLGQAAVEAKFVSAPVVIIIAITAISGFTFYRISGAVILYRIISLLLSSLLGLYGLIFSICLLLLDLMRLRSFGINYMAYLGSFHLQEFKDTIVRMPWWYMKLRPRKIALTNYWRQKH